jgi:hypothetical protein
MCSYFMGARATHIGSPNIRLDPFQRQRCLPGVLYTSSRVAAKSVDHSVSIELLTSWSWFAAALAA